MTVFVRKHCFYLRVLLACVTIFNQQVNLFFTGTQIYTNYTDIVEHIEDSGRHMEPHDASVHLHFLKNIWTTVLHNAKRMTVSRDFLWKLICYTVNVYITSHSQLILSPIYFLLDILYKSLSNIKIFVIQIQNILRLSGIDLVRFEKDCIDQIILAAAGQYSHCSFKLLVIIFNNSNEAKTNININIRWKTSKISNLNIQLKLIHLSWSTKLTKTTN